MAVKYAEHAQATYDKVAGAYDDLWSKNVAEPNARLTRDLGLTRGEGLADLACGTGTFTLDMARAVAPGKTIGVDYSDGMLAAGRALADAAGLPIEFQHAKAEEFIINAAPASFDVVSMRFALAYLEWRDVLPRIARMLRPGGRVGILTSLSASIPQAWTLYRRFMEGFGEAQFTFPVPDTLDQLVAAITQEGLVASTRWEYRVRLWFATGEEAADWMKESGYATHPSLGHIDPAALDGLRTLFAAGMETFREEMGGGRGTGIPLDLVIAAAVAGKPKR